MSNIHLIRDYSLFFLIAFFLFIFLSAILAEKTSQFVFVTVLLLAISLLTFGFYHTHKKIISKPLHIMADLEMVVSAIIGAVFASFLNINLHLGPVIGAAGVGVVAGFGLPMFSQVKIKNLAAAVYCGAFVGMTAATRFSNPLLVGLAGGIAGIVFVASQNVFLGCGGKMGTISFIGTATVMLLIGVLHV
jgi:hypothetical protein